MGLSIIEKSRGIWSGKNYSTLLYYLPILIFGGLIISHILGAVFCQLLFDISFFSSTQEVFNPENKKQIDAMKLMQFFNAAGTFFVPPILFLHLRGLKFSAYLKLQNPISLKGLVSVLIMAFAMIPLANFLGYLNEGVSLPEFLNFLKVIEEQTLLITEQFLIMDSSVDLLLMILLIGLVAAVGEELLFRGVLQNFFQEWWGSKHAAIWVTAFLFSVIHLQYHAVLPRFILGALIGYVYVNSGNLRSAILLHFFYNTTLLIITFMIQHDGLDASWEMIGVENFLMVLLATFVLAGALLKLVPRLSDDHKTT